MPLAILPVMIFGGLFVNLETIPDAFHWLQYISPIKYVLRQTFLLTLSPLRSPD